MRVLACILHIIGLIEAFLFGSLGLGGGCSCSSSCGSNTPAAMGCLCPPPTSFSPCSAMTQIQNNAQASYPSYLFPSTSPPSFPSFPSIPAYNPSYPTFPSFNQPLSMPPATTNYNSLPSAPGYGTQQQYAQQQNTLAPLPPLPRFQPSASQQINLQPPPLRQQYVSNPSYMKEFITEVEGPPTQVYALPSRDSKGQHQPSSSSHREQTQVHPYAQLEPEEETGADYDTKEAIHEEVAKLENKNSIIEEYQRVNKEFEIETSKSVPTTTEPNYDSEEHQTDIISAEKEGFEEELPHPQPTVSYSGRNEIKTADIRKPYDAGKQTASETRTTSSSHHKSSFGSAAVYTSTASSSHVPASYHTTEIFRGEGNVNKATTLDISQSGYQFTETPTPLPYQESSATQPTNPFTDSEGELPTRAQLAQFTKDIEDFEKTGTTSVHPNESTEPSVDVGYGTGSVARDIRQLAIDLKKREGGSTDESQTNGIGNTSDQQHFDDDEGVSNQEEQNNINEKAMLPTLKPKDDTVSKCNSAKLMQMMHEKMSLSPTTSKQLIYSAATELYPGRNVDVICSRHSFSYIVVTSPIFCEHRKRPLTCFAFFQP